MNSSMQFGEVMAELGWYFTVVFTITLAAITAFTFFDVIREMVKGDKAK